MDKKVACQLFERNQRLIAAVKAKAERVCPGALDLIGITGSFHSGDFYEKSDLDLLIVINDESGWRLAKGFILDDIGYDIYCQTWEDLEHAAGYPNPHVMKLLDAELVYIAGQAVEERYFGLRKQLQAILDRPLCMEDLEKAQKHFASALHVLGKLCLTENSNECKYLSSHFLYYVEYTIYMANKAYVQHGVQGIPKELCALKHLPEEFEKAYRSAIMAEGRENILHAASDLGKRTAEFLEKRKESLGERKKPSANELEGSYEEIFSNWHGKMHRAVQLKDPYLALMTAGSCQNFFDEMAEAYAVPRFQVFPGFGCQDTSAAAEGFDRVMEEYAKLYSEYGVELCRYTSMEEFERAYLR